VVIAVVQKIEDHTGYGRDEEKSSAWTRTRTARRT
jgi:hypothetical protein